MRDRVGGAMRLIWGVEDSSEWVRRCFGLIYRACCTHLAWTFAQLQHYDLISSSLSHSVSASRRKFSSSSAHSAQPISRRTRCCSPFRLCHHLKRHFRTFRVHSFEGRQTRPLAPTSSPLSSALHLCVMVITALHLEDSSDKAHFQVQESGRSQNVFSLPSSKVKND